MKILVTGGLGVIGSRIVSDYLDEGHHVMVIDSAEEKRNRWILRQLGDKYGFTKLSVGICRLEEVRDLDTSEFDRVIHAAAHTGIPHSVIDPNEDWVANVDGTRVLLEALRKNPVPTVVLSSVKPYALRQDSLEPGWSGLTESDPLEPDEPYAASKAAQSMLAMAYAKSYGIPIVTLRCSNLYGAAPCHGPRHGWLTWFVISAAIGRPIEIQGDGRQRRDMLFSSDVTMACRLAGIGAEMLSGRVFNIGGGRDRIISVGAAAAQLEKWTGVKIVYGSPRKNDDDTVYVNYDEFNGATGWSPTVSVLDGMKTILEWALNHVDELREMYE